jgi:hypothetical protein
MFDRKHATIDLRRNQSRVYHFPGGSVEVARTSDGDYWAHIATNTPKHHDDPRDVGRVTDGRIDRTDGRPMTITDLATIDHVAIRISSDQDGKR